MDSQGTCFNESAVVLSKIISVICAVTAAVVLVAWHFGLGSTSAANAGQLLMRASAALGLLLASVALLLGLQARRRSLVHAARAAAWTTVALGVLALLQSGFGIDLGLSRMLALAADDSPLQNFCLAPVSAVAVALIGLATAFLDQRGKTRPHPTEIAALATLFIGLTEVMVYLHGLAVPGSAQGDSMPLHGALLFCLLAVGCLTARPDRGVMAVVFSPHAGGFMARRILPLIVLVAVVIALGKLCAGELGYLATPRTWALIVVLNLACFATLVWYTAAWLNRTDATRAKKASLVVENEVRLRTALAHSHLAIYDCDQNLHFTWVGNPIGDVEPAKMIGKGIVEVYADYEGLDAIDAAKREVLRTGIAMRREFRLTRHGDVSYFDTSIVPMRGDDGVITGTRVMVVNVTPLKTTEDALKRSEEFNKRIVENSNDCIKMLDVDGRVVYMNRRGLEALGITDPHDVIGKNWIDMAKGLQNRNARRAFSMVRQGLVASYQFEQALPRGGTIWWDTSLSPLRDAVGIVTRVLGISRDITRLRMQQEALRESEDRLQIALAATHIGIWDWRAGVLTCSDYVYEIFGVERGMPLSVDCARSIIHPDDRTLVTDALRPPSDAVGVVRREVTYRIIRPCDGKLRWIDTHGQGFVDETGKTLRIIGTVRDVTERKKTEDDVANAKHLFERIAEMTPDLLYIYDIKNRHNDYINPSITKLLGYTQGEMQTPGHSIEQALMHPDDLARLRAHGQQLTSLGEGEALKREFRLRHKNGSYRWVRSREIVFARGPDGKPTCMLGLAHDVTEQKQAEEQLRKAKEAADMANQAKSNFLANMSHEIRTPLGIIMGFAELAMSDQSDTERRNALAAIKRNAEQLSRLIDEILDLSKIEAGHLVIERTHFELAPLVDEVTSQLNIKAQEKGIQLFVVSDGPVPRFVTSDPLRMRQCLLNVIGNAIKFTEQGSVTVTMRTKTAALPKKGQTLIFAVKDTGIGLDEEQQSRIFQPFSQADATTARRFGGTGLGLVLSRRMARALGGDLRLAVSAPGKGSTFKLSFAAGTPEAEKRPEPRKDVGQKTASRLPRLDGMRVLLVEDAPDNQWLLSRILKAAGAETDLASDGREGVEKALASPHDAVLMDIQMPGMDGYEATRTLRSRGYEVPIVALTAHAMRGEKEKTMHAGFTEYLTKPVDRVALVALLSRLSADNTAKPPQVH